MKKNLLHIGAVSLMALCAMPAMAQLNGTGYYRVRNAEHTNNCMMLANDKFSFDFVIRNVAGSASNAAGANQPYAISCVGAYLKNDIHTQEIQSSEIINPESVIYVKLKNSTQQTYNLIAQGTSLNTLAAGKYSGDVVSATIDCYATIKNVDGTGSNSKYTAMVDLKASAFFTSYNIGKGFFKDDNGIFSFDFVTDISGYTPTDEAKWFVDPITYFNVSPEIEYNGKYYTTLKVPFQWEIDTQNNSKVEKIYVITDATNGILQHQELTGTIPAGTPVILECSSNNPAECRLKLPANNVQPRFQAGSTSNASAPPADEGSSYSGTNLLKGTYFCNTDGQVPYQYRATTTRYLDGNHFTAPTDPQIYVLGVGESGHLGFIPATENIPVNKAWLETQAEYTNVAIPVLSLAAGTYYEFPQTVSISCASQGAVIHYTTDGTTPTADSPIYTGPLTLNETTTVKAVAILNGDVSAVVSATYTMLVATPTFSPAAATYNNTQSVTITCATPGATIYYTGPASSPATPTTASTVYTGPISVEKTNMTIKAVAVWGENVSEVASAKYVIQVQKPTVSLAAGTYVGPQTVTASCATEGATIRYTTSGSNPGSSSPIFPSGGLTIDHDMTLKVRAFKSNWTASAITTVAYTITNITVNPTSLTINDSGENNTFEATGAHLSTDNVGVTRSNNYFKPALTATTGTATNNASSWYFTPADGSLSGKVAVTYDGRELKDEGTIQVANNQISKTVNVTYVPDIYIITDNGVQDQWNYNGAQMTNNNGVYTATFTAPKDSTYILFSRKASLGENERWGTRYVLGPNSGGDWVMPFGPTATGTIDVNDDDPIKLPYAGEYTITINTNDNTYPFTITRTINTVATPIISPVAGTYTSAQSVTISCTTPGAEIHYTTDGTTPTADSPVYSAAIPVNSSMTIKAIAMKYGWYNSSEASAAYTILPTTTTTLAQLEQVGGGIVGNHYAISDELIGAWATGTMLWAKDQSQQVNDARPVCQQDQFDYLRETTMHNGDATWVMQSEAWDESNWVALDFSNVSGVNTNSCVGRKLTNIKGYYSNNVNYTLQLSEPPTIGDEVDGYPGYNATNHPKPVETSSDWLYNTYMPANFYTSNHNKEVNGNIVGFQTHNIQTDVDEDLYFMNPKIQEVARIWGVWNDTTQAFTVYRTPWYNHFSPRISGAVNAIWNYNVSGDISSQLSSDNAYCFHAVVSKKTANSRFAADNPSAGGENPSADYAIHPLDFESAQSNWTAVEEVNVFHTPVAVTYYNVMGQQSSKPFEGINIVVTRYSDGSTSAIKVLR